MPVTSSGNGRPKKRNCFGDLAPGVCTHVSLGATVNMADGARGM